MCLILRFETREKAREAKKNPLVAKKDIVTYKKVFEDGRSQWFGFEWRKGWHYYQTGKAFSFREAKASYHLSSWRLEISVGLHSFRKKPYIYMGCGYKRIKTIIPKGALYYTNGGYYVSSELIYP